VKHSLKISLIVIGILSSCATTDHKGKSSDMATPPDNSELFLELADYLKRVPGLHVIKRGDGYMVTVRGGMAGPNAMEEPLYVIDRSRVGNSYDMAAASVGPNDIKRVEVLKDAAATSSYGLQGTNGVIIIHTKNN